MKMGKYYSKSVLCQAISVGTIFPTIPFPAQFPTNMGHYRHFDTSLLWKESTNYKLNSLMAHLVGMASS